MYSDLTKQNLFNNLNISFNFQFFSPTPRHNLAESLSTILRKNIVGLDEYNSDTIVNESNFKLEQVFYGGFKMNSLSTGLLPYNEGIHTLYKILNFIDENGFTTDQTDLTINLTINEGNLNLPVKLDNLNTFKFILNLNEEYIFELWPNSPSRLQKVYRSPISIVYPRTKYLTESSIDYSNPGLPTDYIYPQSRYFGIDFSNIPKGSLSVRYVGGKDYQVKKDNITKLINYIGETMYYVLSDNFNYSLSEKTIVKNISKVQQSISSSVKTYEGFIKNYPNIKLLVDLNPDQYLISANYQNIKENLFNLIVFGKLKTGFVNLDTSTNRLQLKDSTLTECFNIENLDLINCKIEGELSNCILHNCKVRSSSLSNCKFISNNDLKYCNLNECKFETNSHNKISNSYINSLPDAIIYANLNECIVNSGIIAYSAEVDNKTEILTNNKIKK